MAEPHRGDVVLVHFPFTDLRSTKLRPAVVLAIHGEDVIVIGFFSNVPTVLKESWVLIDEQSPYFAQAGLRKASIAKGEKIAVLHSSVIHSCIGSLHPALLEAVIQRVKAALGLPP